jgi:hypothetical protein
VGEITIRHPQDGIARICRKGRELQVNTVRRLPVIDRPLIDQKINELSLAKMLSGANTFEINNIQEHETEASLVR